MEAVLKFDFNEFDDRVAHLRCVKANNMFNVLFDITHNLKKNIERKIENSYSEQQLTSEQTLDLVFEEIVYLMEQQGVNIDELT